MLYLDQDTWERREAVEKYADYTFPYINLGTEVDVTGLLRRAREEELSFYCAMIHTAVRAALEFPNFRYRLVDGRPALCERMDPMFVHMAKGSEQYQLIRGDYCDDLETFCRDTADKMERAVEAERQLKITHEDSMELLYLTCIPWVKYTHFIRTFEDPRTDVIPRLSWGKYEADEKGRIKMPFTVQVHHALADGYHVGKYLMRLQEMLDEFDVDTEE